MLCNTQHAQTFYDLPQHIMRHKHSHLGINVRAINWRVFESHKFDIFHPWEIHYLNCWNTSNTTHSSLSPIDLKATCGYSAGSAGWNTFLPAVEVAWKRANTGLGVGCWKAASCARVKGLSCVRGARNIIFVGILLRCPLMGWIQGAIVDICIHHVVGNAVTRSSTSVVEIISIEYVRIAPYTPLIMWWLRIFIAQLKVAQ